MILAMLLRTNSEFYLLDFDINYLMDCEFELTLLASCIVF